MNTVSISKEKIRAEGGMVVLPIKEYQKLRERVAPTHYLHGKEARALDLLVEQGLKEYRAGKTIRARSLGEALKIHGKKGKRS
jgi:RNA:NAD 2'-phosphotransferase (TPT1/KptA family)